MDSTILRMLDANGNRAREALRVMEDYARFVMNDGGLAGRLKGMRHGLAGVLSDRALGDAILWRDTEGDVGTGIKTEREMERESMGAVVVAAGKRLSEALRVIEECCKTVSAELGQRVEKIRYERKVVEQIMSRWVAGAGMRERFAKVKLYVLLTEGLCHPACGGWEGTLDAILKYGGEKICVQLREKGLEGGELLRRAKIVAEKCRTAGALSIVNDRADIAVMAGADGVHVGQGDVPCGDARRMLGMGKVVGVATENVGQARAAVEAGATYVALGPMFETRTKEKPRLAGPAYAKEAAAEFGGVVPLLPIGGITLGNVGELLAAGMERACVCSAVISQADVGGAVRGFIGIF